MVKVIAPAAEVEAGDTTVVVVVVMVRAAAAALAIMEV
jgi:hypothetical protein